MKQSEYIALDNYLSEYNPDWSFKKILANLDSDEVSVWQPFEQFEAVDLTRHITNLRDEIDAAIRNALVIQKRKGKNV